MLPRQTGQDPFTDVTSASLRNNNSQTSLRSAASTASARTRQRPDNNNLLNPARTRRANGRSTPRIDDDIHEDPPLHPDNAFLRSKTVATTRTGSPVETRASRLRNRVNEEVEFVNRQEDGSFILGGVGLGDALVPNTFDPRTGITQEEQEQALQEREDFQHARDYFTSGAATGKASRKKLELYESMAGPIMARLREDAMIKLDHDKWMYESVDRVQGRYR